MYMRHSRFFSWSIFLAILSIACSSIRAGDEAKKTPTDLGKLLEGQGYVAIPMQRLNVGHLAVEAKLNGRRLLLLVDSGSTGTTLIQDRTEGLGLKWQAHDGAGRQRMGGKWEFAQIEGLQIGSINTGPMTIWNDDLMIEFNKSRGGYADPALDGIIGDNILRAHQTVIDYAGNTLYLKPLANTQVTQAKSSPTPAAAKDRCVVGFWNLSGKDVLLTINGETRTLSKNRSARLELERTFSWRLEDGPTNEVRVAPADAEHEIVLR